MVLPSLSVLEEIAASTTDGFDPEFDPDTETVRYPEADELDLPDLPANDDLTALFESLATGDYLDKEFRNRRFFCPDCGTEELGYAVVCPECASEDTAERVVATHPVCGYTGHRSTFEAGGAVSACPNCGGDVDAGDLDTDTYHECRACETRFEAPESRLDCQDQGCGLFPPFETTERVLYSYALDGRAVERIERLGEFRSATAELLRDRRYEVELDVALPERSEPTHRVHVYGEDPVLGIEVVAWVGEQPSAADVTDIAAVASETKSKGFLTVTGSVSEGVLEAADRHDIGVLRARDTQRESGESEVSEVSVVEEDQPVSGDDVGGELNEAL